jgi:hypothetical protein
MSYENINFNIEKTSIVPMRRRLIEKWVIDQETGIKTLSYELIKELIDFQKENLLPDELFKLE